jgi:WS/DGAT/MGAT family acyltransferase
VPAYAYQRLSAHDNTFLLVEGPNTYMHVTGIAVYGARAFRSPAGGFDIAKFRRAIAALLPRVPRYRQRLQWIPRTQHPVWVDDPDFNLDFHIRHTALPRPGTLEQLREKAARIQSHHLDRSRPLWEIWAVEGLEGDRFALISKLHHCMVDGSSGVDLLQVMNSPDPDHLDPAPPPWVPRPAPSDQELLRSEWQRRFAAPFVAARSFRDFRAQAEDFQAELRVRASAVGRLLGSYASRLAPTPLTGDVGPNRRLEWLDMPLAQLRELRHELGCSLNDIVLAIVTGAVRDLFLRRHVSPEGFDFKVTAPVSVRSDDERGQLDNRVSNWILRLPIDRADPLDQVRAIGDATEELKESRQALGAELMLAAADWAPAFLLDLAARTLARPLPAHLMVTNVPGPQRPLYMTGAEMLAVYPVVPLMPHTALGIGVFSYNGKLFWGLNADPELLPDLPWFGRGLQASFDALARAAGVKRENAAAHLP